jgi:hypothetical protein
MTPPKKDDELKEIFDRYMRDSVPPLKMIGVKERLESRLQTDTGKFDLRELEQIVTLQVTEVANQALKEKLEEERKAREKYEARIIRNQDWFRNILTAIIAIVVTIILARLGFTDKK